MSSITEKELYQLTISTNKALNPMEAPLKMKHARSIIITTHRTREAKSFWTVATRQQLMENRFTAWKFCHLLHKVLREGHPSCLKQSLTHKKMILEMGKLWGHLQDGVGTCIQAYSKLIVAKLEFHQKNELFPGTLLIDFRAIDNYAGDDINIYFQLCVEVFDYLDDIIDLQAKIFASVNTYRMSSMTPQGQCRLAPLIALIQDSNPLYDLSVRLMFKLHDELPNDLLSGHRDRFRELFMKLKHFYENVRPLQYFADLIQVPHLPEMAPNFTSKVDFGSYIPPVVYVQPDPEPIMENLVDTSIVEEQTQLPSMTAPTQIDEVVLLHNAVRDKELTINELQRELSTYRDAVNTMESNYGREVMQLRAEITALNHELTASKEIYTNIQSVKEELEQQLASTPTLMQKATEEEEKAKASEEKFAKLKTMYTEIREEHINLLRQHGESTKLLNKEKQTNAELKSEIEQLKQQTDSLDEMAKVKDEVCNEKTILETQFQEVTQQHEALVAEHEALNRVHRELEANNKLVVEQLTAKLNEFTDKHQELMVSHETLQQKFNDLDARRNHEVENLNTKALMLQETSGELHECKMKIVELEKTLNREQDTHKVDNEKFEASLKSCQTQLATKENDIEELKRDHSRQIVENRNEFEKMQQAHKAIEIELKEKEQALNRLTDEKIAVDNQLQDLLQQNTNLQQKLNAANNETQSIRAAKEDAEIKYESLISSLLHSELKTMQLIAKSKLNDTSQQSIEKTCQYVNEMEKLLSESSIVYQKYCEDKNCAEGLASKSILLGYNFAMLYEQCLAIYNTTTDIEKGQEIFTQINNFSEPLLKLYENFQATDQMDDVNASVGILKQKLTELHKQLLELLSAFSKNVDLENLVQSELSEMDKAIQEAAERFVELLSNARSKDNGIKLEVNEKILDACTTLMECIKILIQKSRILQAEIVSTGRGSTSVREFYKRNSQWTEGLISASKSVAKGANLLVEAANKAVTSETNKNFEIIVAAQEIAACTAQLVIASKVKAPRESHKLSDLTKASRNVSQATGAVVATVKDCNQHLEQGQEIDLSKLTTSQAKTMEMDIHVRVLELEQALQLERLRLASFRRKHYQNTED